VIVEVFVLDGDHLNSDVFADFWLSLVIVASLWDSKAVTIF
jgi:hypothetical protein